MKNKMESSPRGKLLGVLKWLALIVMLLLVVGYFGIGTVAAASLTTPKRDFSTSKTPASLNLTYEDVRFPARGGDVQIAAWFIPNSGGRRGVILVHGKDQSRSSEFAGTFVDLAAALVRDGFSVLMIDLRGHGQSGDAHFSFGLNERRDVEGAADWLKSRGFQPGSIGTLGVSLGAASSIGAAADDPDIGALVEDSGFADWCPIVQLHWREVSGLPDILLPPTLFSVRLLYGYDICDSRPFLEIGRVAPRSVLIIHSTGDVLVPVAEAQKLKAAAPFAETWIVTGPEHARIYNSDPAAYSQKVTDFFDRSLKK